MVLFRNPPGELSLLVKSFEAAARWPGAPRASLRLLDNSPDDSLRAQAGPAGYSHAGVNLGFAAGHGQLMAQAFADPAAGAYLCLNPDAVLHPACLFELAAEASRRPDFGLVEAMQFPDEHAKPWDEKTGEVEWCSGCCLLVSRALYARIGGFDERFFLYGEDVDYSFRAKAAGFSLAIAPRALVHHYVGDRPREHASNQRIAEAEQLLKQKHGRSAPGKARW